MKESISFLIFFQIWAIFLVILFVKMRKNPEAYYQKRRKWMLKWSPWAIEPEDELGGEAYRRKKYLTRGTILFLGGMAFYVFGTISFIKRLM